MDQCCRRLFDFEWSRNFYRELNCSGFELSRLTTTLINVFILIKLVCDIIMFPLCYTLYPNITEVWGSALAFYSFTLSVLNDANLIIIKGTSRQKVNELPYGLVGTLLMTEVCLYAYNGIFFLNARSFTVTNGIIFTLCAFHIAMRVAILLTLKRCPLVRLVKDNGPPVYHDMSEHERRGRRRHHSGTRTHRTLLSISSLLLLLFEIDQLIYLFFSFHLDEYLSLSTFGRKHLLEWIMNIIMKRGEGGIHLGDC